MIYNVSKWYIEQEFKVEGKIVEVKVSYWLPSENVKCFFLGRHPLPPSKTT